MCKKHVELTEVIKGPSFDFYMITYYDNGSYEGYLVCQNDRLSSLFLLREDK